MDKLVFSCLVVAFVPLVVVALDYELIFENEHIFNPCDGMENKTFQHIFDLSNFSMDYDGSHYKCEGSFTTIWDVAPTDHLTVRVEPKAFRYGNWVPTTLNIERKRACQDIFDPKQFFYKVWFQYIHDEDQGKCFNQKGITWHYHPFELIGIFRNIPGVDWSGLYRLITYIMVFDKNNVKKDVYCFKFEAQMQQI